ncbi:MAG: putative lipoprotein [Glaciecola sp.]|jgi:predicted lipoprotein
MKQILNLMLVFTLLLGSVFVSCEKKKKIETEQELAVTYDRKVLLTNLSSAYIIPSYKVFNDNIKSLEQKKNSFIQSPSTTSLEGLRSAWNKALLSWQEIAFLEFGPAADISLRAQTNVYPVDTSLINSNISRGGYNLAIANNFNAKGLQALDYLLYSESDDSKAVDFVATSEVASYVTAVIADLKSNSQYVTDKWTSYSIEFIANSENNADGSSVSIVVNTITNHYEAFIRRGKIGIPSGVFNGFSKQEMPGHVEALYSHKSIENALRSMEAFENFFNGINYVKSSNGEGLSDYLVFTETKKDGQLLATVIQNQINSIKSSILILNEPFDNEVVVNKTKVSDCYQEMQKLVSLLKVDLTASLGVLVNYQDSDGD